MLESDLTEQAARGQSIRRLQTRDEQIRVRLEMMYRDRLDGRIDMEFYDMQAAECRREQESLRAKIQDIQRAAPAPVDQAVDMLRLTSRASELFLTQPAAEQRHLLRVMIEKATWKDGELRTTLFEPSKYCAIRTGKV